MIMLHLASTIVVKYDTKLTREIDFKATVHQRKTLIIIHSSSRADFLDFLYSAEQKYASFFCPDNESQQGRSGFEPH